MNPAILQILKTLGQVGLGIVMQLVTGRAIKRLILWPFEKLAKKTETPTDDKILQDAKEDLGLENNSKKEG